MSIPQKTYYLLNERVFVWCSEMQQVSTLTMSTNIFSPAFPNFSLSKHFCRCLHSHLHPPSISCLWSCLLAWLVFAFFFFFLCNYHKMSRSLLQKVDFLFGHTHKKGLSTCQYFWLGPLYVKLGIIHISCSKTAFFFFTLEHYFGESH